jgi:hypothetical protein
LKPHNESAVVDIHTHPRHPNYCPKPTAEIGFF